MTKEELASLVLGKELQKDGKALDKPAIVDLYKKKLVRKYVESVRAEVATEMGLPPSDREGLTQWIDDLTFEVAYRCMKAHSRKLLAAIFNEMKCEEDSDVVLKYLMP